MKIERKCVCWFLCIKGFSLKKASCLCLIIEILTLWEKSHLYLGFEGILLQNIKYLFRCKAAVHWTRTQHCMANFRYTNTWEWTEGLVHRFIATGVKNKGYTAAWMSHLTGSIQAFNCGPLLTFPLCSMFLLCFKIPLTSDFSLNEFYECPHNTHPKTRTRTVQGRPCPCGSEPFFLALHRAVQDVHAYLRSLSVNLSSSSCARRSSVSRYWRVESNSLCSSSSLCVVKESLFRKSSFCSSSELHTHTHTHTQQMIVFRACVAGNKLVTLVYAYLNGLIRVHISFKCAPERPCSGDENIMRGW